MNIIIVEDERPIARYIEKLCQDILGEKIKSMRTFFTLDQASKSLGDSPVDLCLLDLNLNGDDGYELFQSAASGSFQTIVISANTDRAIEAFEYGVLDFVGKPFDQERLQKAFDRYFHRIQQKEIPIKYLSARKGKKNFVLNIDQIQYFKAAGIYVDAHLANGKIEILDKTMDHLEHILPSRFMRIHRSYLVDVSQIAHYEHLGGGTYHVNLKNGKSLPLSRQKYKELHELFHH